MKIEDRSKRIEIEGERSRAEMILLESYDPRIDAEIQFYQDKFEKLRAKKIDSRFSGKERNLVGQTEEVKRETNEKAISGGLAYFLNCVRELEAMRLKADLDLERINELKARIPPIDEFTQTTGVRAMPAAEIEKDMETQVEAFEPVTLVRVEASRYNSGGEALLYYHGEYSRFDEVEKR